jgi:hypothetical protein
LLPALLISVVDLKIEKHPLIHMINKRLGGYWLVTWDDQVVHCTGIDALFSFLYNAPELVKLKFLLLKTLYE